MAQRISNHRLNDLLIDLGRSLLQYVGESWPWTSADEAAEQARIDALVAEQQQSLRSLTELLAARGHRIDPGSYPTEYTSLHYVALDYLLSQLVEDQQELADECGDVAAEAADDPQAAPLLVQIAQQAADHLQRLRQIAAERASRQPSYSVSG
jgi:hypothetical protein